MADDPLSPIKVRYTRNTEVRVEQPEDVTRAKASAWLDIISPVTQWAGLKGDVLRHKRELFRLEQEATLDELARKLRSRLEGKTVTPIPTKQLVPALEKASLEDVASEFVDKWANLLASAALHPGDDVAICTSILGDIGPSEASLLDQMRERLQRVGLWSRDRAHERRAAWAEYVRGIYDKVGDQFADHIEGLIPEKDLMRSVIEVGESSPCIIGRFEFSHARLGGKAYNMAALNDMRVAIDVLKYRNLINIDQHWEVLDISKVQGKRHRGTLMLEGFQLTDLGAAFLLRVSGATQ